MGPKIQEERLWRKNEGSIPEYQLRQLVCDMSSL